MSTPDTTCGAPECQRPVDAAGLCAAHRKQRQRGRKKLLALIERTPGGTENVTLRVSRPLRAAMQATAKRLGLRTERSAWESAAREWLLRRSGR